MNHAARPTVTVEALEARRLLAFTGPNFDLPFVNDFSAQRNGVEDQDGQNTGFPIVQGNDAGDEYQPSLIDLDTDDGFLRLTSRGDADFGGNFGTDNSLANGLQIPFDAAEGEFLIHTRISAVDAPLTQFDTPFEQAGLMFGPTQDNFAKLVFANDGDGTVVQFVVENRLGTNGTFVYPGGEGGQKSVVTDVRGVDLENAGYVDLFLSGDPDTGELMAQYRVEGGQTVRFDEPITIPEISREAFFRENEARAGLVVQHKNDGEPITVTFDEFGVTREDLPSDRPAVEDVRPAAGDDDVLRDAFIGVDLQLPNAGLDEGTLTDETVYLERADDALRVPANINTSGGGDAIILQPLVLLDPATEYRFVITDEVTDLFGVNFDPYEQTFTTNLSVAGRESGVAFEQVQLPQTQGTLYTSVNIGPDGRLYTTTVDGRIIRYDVDDDGTLGDSDEITSIVDAEGGMRVMTGLAFSPDSTADDLTVYVTHTDFNDVTTDRPDELGDDFTGKVTRLTGDDLEDVQDVVTNLPRSIRDHLTNQPNFGPDGRLYVPQGANTAMGAPDAQWGFRPERFFTASILAINVDAIGDGTVDARTNRDGGSYDPLADDAPVVAYATGVRNAYDLVFHSNGSLYAPTNGSAAGGNTPQSPQPDDPEYADDRTDLDENGPFEDPQFVPGLNNVPQTQSDFLFRIEEGGYYGATNPVRDEYVMNGGNPTAGFDGVNEVPAYPVGTEPDRNYRGFAYEFGKNLSPNGALEYTSDAFDGALQNRLLVTRYSGGDDVVALTVNDDGEVTDAQEGIAGLGGFNSPLDLAQRDDGSMYVIEFGAQRITLVRPVEAGGVARVESRRDFFNAGPGETATRPFTIRNDGDAALILSGFTLTFTGEDARQFTYAGDGTPGGEGDSDQGTDNQGIPEDGDASRVPPTVSVAPGESYSFPIAFTAPADAEAGDRFSGAVSVRTNDPDAPEVTTRLEALVTAGQFAESEPSLQNVLDLYGFAIDTGDDDASDNAIDPGGDLIESRLFRRANEDEAVTIVPIASFGPDSDPAASVGYYPAGRPDSRLTLQEISGVQQVDPAFSGAVKFQPAAGVGETFGLWMQTPTFTEADGTARVIYSQDQLNLWEPDADQRRKVFTYPIEGVEDAYIVAFEEFEDATDANDVVLIVRNVEPVAADGPRLEAEPELAVPFSQNLVFSSILPGGLSSNQQVQDEQSVTIRNIGGSPATLNDAAASGEFDVSDFDDGVTLDPGETTTLVVSFTAGSGDLPDGDLGEFFDGTLSISGDGDADLSLPLAAYLQRYTEDGAPVNQPGENAEPELQEIVDLFGYGVDVGSLEELQGGGEVEAVGDEVLSELWTSAGPDTPIEVYQLNAFHSPAADFFAWYPEGQRGVANRVTTHESDFNQSLLPADTDGEPLAFGTFTPGEQVFGVRVSQELSENVNGHRLRFYPLRDAAGNLVEDAWIVAMDFDAFNFDYNDNVYVVRGMRPAALADAPVGVSAFRDGNGEVVIDWGAAPGGEGDQFEVFRSVGGRDDFTKLGRGLLNRSFAYDGDPPDEDESVYYRVFAVADDGERGMFSDVRLT